MRIACLYLPAFALQVHVRQAPHRAGTAFAVACEVRNETGKVSSTGRTLLVCSRAAWNLGLRPGMSAPQARARAPSADILGGDSTLYQRSLEALAESLMAHSLSIDIGAEYESSRQAHICIYLRMPQSTSGDTFALALLGLLNRQGYKGRVGIADNRFTAQMAALHARTQQRRRHDDELFAQDHLLVPRGKSAAFLAPLPITSLPLGPDTLGSDIQHILETLGIKTLGDFASLPPPSVGRRWNADGIDFQSLAKGDGPTWLQNFSPLDLIVESIDMEHEAQNTEALSFALRPLADRICDRLRGRGMAASRIVLRLKGRDNQDRASSTGVAPPLRCTELVLNPVQPTQEGRKLFTLLRALIQDIRLEHPVSAMELSIAQETKPYRESLDLFAHTGPANDKTTQLRPSPSVQQQSQVGLNVSESVDIAVTRLESMLGKDAVRSAQLNDSHRPEKAFHLTPFVPPHSSRRRTTKGAGSRNRGRAGESRHSQDALPLVMNGSSGAMRLINPPQLLPDFTPQGSNGTEHSASARNDGSIEIGGIRHAIVSTFGPTKIEAEWWSDAPIARQYYEVETEDGGRYWIFEKEEDSRFYLHGIFD